MASDLNFEYPQLLHAIFECMGEGLYAIGADGRVLFINPTASRILGYAPEELIGKIMHDTTHYKHPDGIPFPRHECEGFQVIANGRIVRVEQDFFIRKNGSFRACVVYIVAHPARRKDYRGSRRISGSVGSS